MFNQSPLKLSPRPTAKAHHWEDSYWINPPFHEYQIVAFDLRTATAEGSVQAAIGQVMQLRKEGINAIMIHADSAFIVTSARQLARPVATGAVRANEAYELKHFIDVCHYEGIAVCLDVACPAPRQSHAVYAGTLPPADNGPFIEQLLNWLSEYHVDALRLDGLESHPGADRLIRQVRRAIDQLTRQTGRQYYLLVNCEASPVAVEGHFLRQPLCEAAQITTEAASTTQNFRRDLLYNRQFAHALEQIYGQAS